MPLLATLGAGSIGSFKNFQRRGNPNAWNIATAYLNSGTAAWDLATTDYSNFSYSTTGIETTPTGVFFKPDGTKMYVVGAAGDEVNEFDLSKPWVISSTSVSLLQTFSVAAQTINPQDIFFKSDGTKMYIIGNSGVVYEYTLSAAWDISTASYVQSFSVADQDTNTKGIYFSPNGTKMFVIGVTNDRVYEYSLSVAWDISTTTYVQFFSVSAEDSNPYSLSFKFDGTIMYVLGRTNDRVFQYSLTTPWDISTASFVKSTPTTSTAGAEGIYFRPDGSGFYIAETVGPFILQYNIGTLSVASEELNVNEIFFKPDGTKMYIIGNTDAIREYDLSTAWDILTATYLQGFSGSTEEGNPNGLFFKPDGTRMYTTGSSGADVNEYALSNPWNISTSSFVQATSISAQDTVPQAIHFKPDGTKMFILGSTDDKVYEYSLSTAWNSSTRTFLRSFSVAGQDTTPVGLFFKPDGTIMYVAGAANDNVYEYSLSTPWQVDTATYLRSFGLYTPNVTGLFFKPDGEQFYVTDTGLDTVSSYLIA